MGYPDNAGTSWYVSDPSTGLTQHVHADAECTARWIAWSRWRGSMPANEDDEAKYAALEVIEAIEDRQESEPS